MKLRHQYNSASAYERCGYERIPAYPCIGEEVTMFCRTEPHDPQAKLRLIWAEDGSPQPVISGIFQYTDEEGRGYYEFRLPPLPDAMIEYHIEAVLPVETVKSERFTLEPLQTVVVPQLTGAWQVGNSLFLGLCAGKKEFFWTWETSGSSLHSRLAPAYTPPPKACELPDIYRLELLPGIFAEFRRSPFSFALASSDGELLRLEANNLHVQLDRMGALWELHLQLRLAANAIYGLGERFNSVNQMGKQIIISSEEKFTDQGERSYLPIPFFFTDRGIGLLHEAGYESRYTFTPMEGQDGFATAELCFSCDKECRDTLFFGTPADQVRQYLSHTGPAVLPPRWAFGPWASSNRWETQQQAEDQLTALQINQIPTTVFVLERWSDDTTFDCFEDVSHSLAEDGKALDRADFRFEEGSRWPDPCGLADRIHALGMKLILWQAPILRQPPNASEQCLYDFRYAVEHHYCVMQPDGSPFLCPEGWFAGSLLIDFTNPEAVHWWMKKREWLVRQLHADGFKTDSGELVTDDRSIFANGKTGREMRNLYPMAYEEAYGALLQEYCPDGVNFTRTGYTGAQKYPFHWTGDQRSTFAELRAQIRAALSAGLSGVLFIGTDLAGFAGEMPTEELYCRGVSLSAFSGLMQFHSEPTEGRNNDRSPWNLARLRHDPSLLEHYRRYANIRMCLLPYLYNEAIHCVEEGRPLMAHLLFDYPDTPLARHQEDSYLLGRSLLVAPVLESGARGRQIYFPAGKWVELATGAIHHTGEQYVTCCTNEIPVFLKWGSALSLALSGFLSFGGDEPYGEQLCILCAGDGHTKFHFSPGSSLTLVLEKGKAVLTGDCPEDIVLLALTGEPPHCVRINGSTCFLKPVMGLCWGRSIPGVQVIPHT